MNEQEQAGFNLAVDLYTNLLFNQKELLTRIIDVAYSHGVTDGIAYGRQEYIDAVTRAEEQEVEVEAEPEYVEPPKEKVQPPKVQPPKLSEVELDAVRSPAEELIAKMKGVKR